MKAKHLIYTSWKNGESTNKGFMVYSKSVGITDEESVAIQVAMKYERPNELPLLPTPEEIEKVFPRACAFFPLPSGNYCLAQSAYIGKDYTGTRGGNYIIDAYVFEGKPELDGFAYIGSSFFKKNLTQEEADAPSGPAPLPEVEIPPSSCPIKEADLIAFLNNGNLEKFKKLLRAVMYGKKNGKKVYLFDDWANIPYWYRAIELALPRKNVDDLSFSTFSIGLRNSAQFDIVALKPSAMNDPATLLKNGELVYNFKGNITNETLPVSLYVNNVAEALSHSVSEAQKVIAGVEKYLDEAGGDPDFSMKISSFYALDSLAFPTSDSLLEIVKGIEEASPNADKNRLALTLREYLKKGSFSLDKDKEMYRYILANDPTFEELMLEESLKKLEGLAYQEPSFSSGYATFLADIIVMKNRLLGYIEKKHPALPSYLVSSPNPFLAYALFRMEIELNGSGKEPLVNYLMPKYFKERKQALLKEFAGLLKSGGYNYSAFLIKEINAEISAGKIDIPYYFSFADDLPEADIYKLVANLIILEGKDPGQRKLILNFVTARNLTMEKIVAASGNNPVVVALADSLVFAEFPNKKHTDQELQTFFENYYQTGKDKGGLFIKAYESHLFKEGLTYEGQLESVGKWEAYFASHPLQFVDLPKVKKMHLSLLDDVYFGQMMNARKNRNALAAISSLANAYRKDNGRYPDSYSSLIMIERLAEANKGHSSNSEFEKFLYDLDLKRSPFSKKCVTNLAKHAPMQVAELYWKIVSKRAEYVSRAIDLILYPFLQEDMSFSQAWVAVFNKNCRRAEMESYLAPLLQRDDTLLNRLVADYIKSQGFWAKGYIKKLQKSETLDAVSKKTLDHFLRDKIWK